MAFEREVSIVPEDVEDITVLLVYPNPASERVASASYSVQIKYNDGSINIKQGDLVPHITQQQINGLMGFMEILRTKAITEFIGE